MSLGVYKAAQTVLVDVALDLANLSQVVLAWLDAVPGHKTTSSVKFDPRFGVLRAQFSMWWEILEIGPRFHVFLANFMLRMHRNGQNSTSARIHNFVMCVYAAIHYVH